MYFVRWINTFNTHQGIRINNRNECNDFFKSCADDCNQFQFLLGVGFTQLVSCKLF